MGAGMDPGTRRARPAAVAGELAGGVATLGRGFGFWRVRPGLMTLGPLPALLAFLLLAAALVPLLLSLGTIAEAITPFADGWVEGWRIAVRVVAGSVVLLAGVLLAAAVFTALALTIGDPFYQRIWRAVEQELGDPPAGEGSFWAGVGEGLRLVVLAVVTGAVVLLVGFVPLVGGPLAFALGVVLNGRMLARELTGRAFDARRLSRSERLALFRGRRARTLAFGVAAQLCVLVPLGAVLVMPAAVAGGTMLARDLLAAAGDARAEEADRA